MPRTEPEIDFTVPAVGYLAEHLRKARDICGFSNPQLAELIGVDVSTVRRAVSGRQVPKLSLVLRWAEVCKVRGMAPRNLWKKARYESRIVEFGPRSLVPKTELIKDAADLSAALVECYERAGAPSTHVMEKRAGGHGELPHNTADRIIKKLTLPGTAKQCEAFLLACEVPQGDHSVWIRAWERATRNVSSVDASLEARLLKRRIVPARIVPAPTQSSESKLQRLGSRARGVLAEPTTLALAASVVDSLIGWR
jgi:transcriptional regulator with XRE-family HTH domain